VAKIIRCEDGAVIRDKTDEELLANAQQHDLLNAPGRR